MTGFDAEAYGAVLTLVYLRAMPLAVRNDLHMRFMARGGLWGGRNTGLPANQLAARRSFYGRLNALHQEAYCIASFDALTNANNPWPYQSDSLVTHPWTLSDTEFLDGMVLLRHKKMPDLVGEEPDPDERTKQATSAVSAVLKDEFIDFIADFVQEAAKDLRPLLRGSVQFGARASIVGAILETLLDIAASGRIDYVRDLFKNDEPRRQFLRSVSWGEYQAPGPMKPPTAPAYAPNLGAGPS